MIRDTKKKAKELYERHLEIVGEEDAVKYAVKSAESAKALVSIQEGEQWNKVIQHIKDYIK
jgi:hypothetical protein